MKEYGNVVFKDGHEESIVAYEKVYSVDPTNELIKFKTKTSEYSVNPLSSANVIGRKDGEWFVADDIKLITLY